MDFSLYSEEIKNLSEKIMETRRNNRQDTVCYCQQMIAYGKETKDPYLLGFAYFFLAEYYRFTNKHQSFILMLSEGIGYQQQSGQWNLLSRSYNILGSEACSQGNMIDALNHYLTALEYCEYFGTDYEKAMIYTNFGYFYLGQQDYYSARMHFDMAKTLYQQNLTVEFAQYQLMLVNIGLAQTCLLMEMPEAAEACLKEAEEYVESKENKNENILPVMCFRARLLHQQGKSQECDTCCMEIIEELSNCWFLTDFYNVVKQFISFLLDAGRLEDFIKATKSLENVIKELESAKIEKDFLKFWIRYYKMTNQHDKYMDYCRELYEIEHVLEEENLYMVREFTTLRLKLEESKQKENAFHKERQALIQMSETDALTGMANRHKLNAYLEEVFEKAYHSQKSLGVEMVDIDYFKKYNDTYGHQAGDEIIKKLAQCLMDICREEEAFCARYGGDEFVLVYYDKSDEEILRIAGRIKERVQKMDIKSAVPGISGMVTISQGIRNAVLKNGSRVWDLMFSADAALYKVKQNGKDGIYLVHQMEVENDYTFV